MKKLFAMALAASFAVPVSAQELKIADGSSSGTYAAMLGEMKKLCGDAIKITEVPATGAVDNLDKVVGNEANAGFMHSDVLFFRSKTEDLNHLKTLLALFPEDVHFLARNQPFKRSGLLDMARAGTTLDSVADLANLPVGAAGGGYITAQVVRLQGEIPYTVVQFDSGKEVLAALDSGKIAAAIFVGAAPLPNLKDLGKEYKLLSVGESVAAKLKSVYRPSQITYTHMSPSSVSTVAADALLITREYKTPKFVEALRTFRKCFFDNLDELKETPGTHRAWQKVDAKNHGKWPWYSFSETR